MLLDSYLGTVELKEAEQDSITSLAMQDCRISPAYALIPPCYYY